MDSARLKQTTIGSGYAKYGKRAGSIVPVLVVLTLPLTPDWLCGFAKRIIDKTPPGAR